jgi:hypothetical protein
VGVAALIACSGCGCPGSMGVAALAMLTCCGCGCPGSSSMLWVWLRAVVWESSIILT